jgi:hypothetical protein
VRGRLFQGGTMKLGKDLLVIAAGLTLLTSGLLFAIKVAAFDYWPRYGIAGWRALTPESN